MKFLRFSFSLLALAVVLGAFGAHTLEKYVDAQHLHTWHTGVEYHFYHALGLLLLSAIADKNFILPKRMQLAQIFLALGILMFSGSLYLLAVRPEWSWLGPVTPLGGLCFITGWILAALSVKRINV